MNILFNERTRRKNKSFWDHFSLTWYYEKENIPFKEKVYTFHYNLQRTGLTTKGELDWSIRMMELDFDGWKRMETEFKNDYREFLGSYNSI